MTKWSLTEDDVGISCKTVFHWTKCLGVYKILVISAPPKCQQSLRVVVTTKEYLTPRFLNLLFEGAALPPSPFGEPFQLPYSHSFLNLSPPTCLWFILSQSCCFQVRLNISLPRCLELAIISSWNLPPSKLPQLLQVFTQTSSSQRDNLLTAYFIFPCSTLFLFPSTSHY